MLEYSFIREGLALNPRYLPLKITEIQFLRFASCRGSALDSCRFILDNLQFSNEFRQLAFAEMIEILVDQKEYKKVLDIIDKNLNNLSFYKVYAAIQHLQRGKL